MIAAALGLVPALRAQDVVMPVGHQDCAPACPTKCCKEKVHKKCVPIEKKKVVEKVVYGSVCEDFCLPNCHGMRGCGKKSCDSCNPCPTTCNNEPCHKCEKHVRHRKYLTIKIRKHEECVAACEAVECAPACCAPPPCCGSAPTVISGPSAEKLPNKPSTTDPMKK
jgi:hypothetical protein